MLLHEGVMKWIYNWKKYPVPNEFLGITSQNKNIYESLPIESKCTLR